VTHPDTVSGLSRHRVVVAVLACARRGLWQLWGMCCLVVALGLGSLPAHAQGVELPQLRLSRQDGALMLDFEVRLSLSRAVEEAMQRGVPLYFTAQAEVFRPRWYWRDDRVARATRTWRLSYQPLTASWRVSFGGLSQSVASAEAALAMVSRSSSWRITEGETIDNNARYYVEFSYRLDSTMLPRPMQLDLAAQADWRLAIERTLKLD
jgi:hypothetical protein